MTLEVCFNYLDLPESCKYPTNVSNEICLTICISVEFVRNKIAFFYCQTLGPTVGLKWLEWKNQRRSYSSFLLHASSPSHKVGPHTCGVHPHPSYWELLASLAWSEMKETESLSKIQVIMGKVIIGKVVLQL